MKPFTIGSFTFSDEGVCQNSVPYSKEPFPIKRVDDKKFYFDVRSLIQHRMLHCYAALDENFCWATYVSDQVIVWEGGHFSVPMYQAMKDWLATDPGNVPQIIAQQALRQMFEEQSFSDKELFYYLTEVILFAE